MYVDIYICKNTYVYKCTRTHIHMYIYTYKLTGI